MCQIVDFFGREWRVLECNSYVERNKREVLVLFKLGYKTKDY